MPVFARPTSRVGFLKAGRDPQEGHVALLGHIILTPGEPVFILIP